ncbi:MAG TPA: hypothetical protein VD767_03765 [Thermomicrobiales bacterium]|nr:hypothetical protein [Thermomicrobiales bacterium]
MRRIDPVRCFLVTSRSSDLTSRSRRPVRSLAAVALLSLLLTLRALRAAGTALLTSATALLAIGAALLATGLILPGLFALAWRTLFLGGPAAALLDLLPANRLV